MSARRKASRRKVPESYNKTVRKGDLVKMLREKHGMSKRKAAAAVNAVFADDARFVARRKRRYSGRFNPCQEPTRLEKEAVAEAPEYSDERSVLPNRPPVKTRDCF